MNQRTTVEELRYWLKKANAAPWEVMEIVHDYDNTKFELYADNDVATFYKSANAEFCAAARNLLPEVLAELEALRAELAALKEVVRG